MLDNVIHTFVIIYYFFIAQLRYVCAGSRYLQLYKEKDQTIDTWNIRNVHSISVSSANFAYNKRLKIIDVYLAL